MFAILNFFATPNSTIHYLTFIIFGKLKIFDIVPSSVAQCSAKTRRLMSFHYENSWLSGLPNPKCKHRVQISDNNSNLSKGLERREWEKFVWNTEVWRMAHILTYARFLFLHSHAKGHHQHWMKWELTL